jgi:Family of unknown function (DUF5654)
MIRDVRVFVQTMITLSSASLGLVSALAWNEAIKATITTLLGKGDSLRALYTYAVTATVLAVVILSVLAYIAARIGGEAMIHREAD